MKLMKAGAAALAMSVASATMVVSADDAEAQRWRGRAVLGGVVGGLALGALLGSRSWGYYGYGPGYYGYGYRPAYSSYYGPRYYRSSWYEGRPVSYRRVVYRSRHVRPVSSWCY